jgi:hypothetical protein
MWGKGANKLWPRMACSSLCGYADEMRRPHMSCFGWCRIRRYFYGKLDLRKYHYNRFMRVVVPVNCENYALLLGDFSFSKSGAKLPGVYVILIDKGRKHAWLKDLLLKRLLKVLEGERSYDKPLWIRTLLLFRKQCLTICEGLAN